MEALLRARPAFELGLDLCAFLFLPILVLASRGAAPLGAAAGICALCLSAPRADIAWRRVRGQALLFGAVLAWGVVSALWAVEPGRSLLIAARLGGLFAIGLSLMAAAEEIAAPRRLLQCLAVGLAVALLLAVVQLESNGALTAHFSRRAFLDPTLNQSEDGFGFVLLPLCAALVSLRRPFAAFALAVAAVTVIFLLAGDAARVAFVLGTACAAAFYRWRRGLARLAAIGSVLLIFAAPLVFPPLAGISGARHDAEAVKFSMWHRLEIWSFVGSRIAEKPLFGWGLDSSRAIPGGSALTPEGRAWLPLHPHNAALQVWLELGLPGAILLALLTARLWLALSRVDWPPLYAAAASGSLVTAFIVALGSYGIWQEWLIASEFLTLFLVLVMARIATETSE